MLTTTEMMTPAKTPLSEMLNVLTLEDRRPGGQDDSLTSASVLALCLVEDGGCDNVIKQYYNTLCGSEEVLPLCRSSRTVCM